MFTRVISFSRHGVEALPVAVEVDVGNGLPAFELVGMPGSATRESRERVRAAIRNAGGEFPARRITVNLAPAGVPKEGAGFDLAIALGILAATGQVPAEPLDGVGVVGELSLDGSLRPVRAALPIGMTAQDQGCTGLVVPEQSAAEAALAGLKVYPAANLAQVMAWLRGEQGFAPTPVATPGAEPSCGTDLIEVRGQPLARRALEIAAAGGHNLLMIGPPGVGKSMLARALAGILPPLSLPEALEVTAVYSAAGLGGGELIRQPPFRAPHHSSTRAALLGGGTPPNPGELSLAHRGVLFLDELPEFGRDALEALRQPLEEGVVRLSRAGWRLTLPARVQVVAAANPCPCGYLGDARRACSCPPAVAGRYRERLSGPLLDRFDLQVWLGPVSPRDLSQVAAEDSATVAARVCAARNQQRERYVALGCEHNAAVPSRELAAVTDLDPRAIHMLNRAVERLSLSVRARDRVVRVARTIADLAGARKVQGSHVAEALQYRLPLPGR